jgi:hypothetical protein
MHQLRIKVSAGGNRDLHGMEYMEREEPTDI